MVLKEKTSLIFEKMKNNKFNSTLITLLLIIFLCKLGTNTLINIDKNLKIEDGIIVFIQPSCSHCHALQNYINTLEDKEKYNFKFYDITQKKYSDLLFQYISQKEIKFNQIGTPLIITKNNYQIGFVNTEEDKEKFINLIKNNKKIEEVRKTTLKIPFFGKIDLTKLSLPLLTIIVGLADGFNPCAMWVLVYLISITATLKNRNKLIVLVGTFVLTSGILYFLFMTAWLNAFLMIGFIYILSLIIGLIALYFGISSVYEFIKNKGVVQCKLSNNQTRQKSMSKIKELIKQNLSFSIICGITALAFVVNSIEFLCSAALPATYTYILTKMNLSMISYYLYILFYTILYMLDDLIIFGCAIFAINKYAGEKYEKYSTLIGGIVMTAIGILIVFFPQMLK